MLLVLFRHIKNRGIDVINAWVIFVNALGFSCSEYVKERQLSSDLTVNHDLDNNDNFSPDDKWLVYDTRTPIGGIGACGTIEQINTVTGEKVILYHLPQNQAFGPGVGAVSYSHTSNEVAFIHGLLNCSEEQPYQQWRRTGVIVNTDHPNTPIWMDARDVTPPYTQGALRGGTHRHEWSGDGNWIGFTYNDALLQLQEEATGEIHNLRTIGVSRRGFPIGVATDSTGENFSGEWSSAIVVDVVPHPTPGSDQISRAAGDSWVGMHGYLTSNGSRQLARAFIGTVRDKNNQPVDEVFIVDIPEDITKEQKSRPLAGTVTTMPAPPEGAQQRRLTYTANSPHPGCEGIVRSSSDGQWLAFLAYDPQGIKQLFTISPQGNNLKQQTHHKTDVQSGVRWHPEKKEFYYVWNNSIVKKNVSENLHTVLTAPSSAPPTNLVWSHDGATIAFNREVSHKGLMTKQIFLINL
ncbi:MAG: DUF3748 domain-containing protein [Cyclobacteriaceae bacterium]